MAVSDETVLSPHMLMSRPVSLSNLLIVVVWGGLGILLFVLWQYHDVERIDASGMGESLVETTDGPSEPVPPSSQTPVTNVAEPFAVPAVSRFPEAPLSNNRVVADRQRRIKLGVGASLEGFRPFPNDNAWNRDVSRDPVDPMSAALIASIGFEKTLHPDFGSGEYEGAPIGIPYVVVSSAQPPVPVEFTEYGDESDPGPYPIPRGTPIEGDPNDGDRHVIVIDRDNWKLYEMFHSFEAVGGLRWSCDNGAVWDMTTNHQRPEGWTSADAAGLPIFPGLVRRDEVERGEILHALRFTVSKTRRAYVPPATHWASRDRNPALPPMGMRVRLKQSFDISGYPRDGQVILTALKKYGMILADNGSDWFISGAPDERWDNDVLRTLKQVKGKDLEVLRMGTMTAD